jgi:phosphate transport system permease protein
MKPESTEGLPPADPNRFEVGKATLWFDRVMTQIIRIGGLAVILAIFGIFFFIFKEVLPLFQKPHAQVEETREVEQPEPWLLGVDEWGELPFLYAGGNELIFVEMANGQTRRLELGEVEGREITAASYDPTHQRIALGTADGDVGSFVIHYRPIFEDGERRLEPEVTFEAWSEIDVGEGAVTQVAYGEGDGRRVVVAARERGAAALRLAQEETLFGAGELRTIGVSDLSDFFDGRVAAVVASQNGKDFLVGTEVGKILYFRIEEGEVTLRQTFEPFAGEVPVRMDFLFGSSSLSIVDAAGEQRIFGLFRREESDELKFGRTKSFEPLGGGRVVFAPSLRNKSFVVGSGRELAVRHLTSESTRWRGELEFEPVAAAFDGKVENFFVAGPDAQIQRFSLEDPHPEASWKAFFGKVWYEGGPGPVYQWQSTGGTDDFEPKLSLVPLIIGSLKGTFYALLFSLPVALLAAVFSACFLTPAMKRVVKPAMEIMASLPSVVLGFLAGLWLAPLIDDKVPSILLTCLALPVVAVGFGWFWSRRPIALRSKLENGREWIALTPLLLAGGWLAWSLGPVLESWLFVVENSRGEKVGDFRLWWPHATGLSYDQRNSMVVGFMMGFAVIPIIFTIAEDALSNVPRTLTAAASALGASRWQVVRTIVIPVASPGIFSALMIGFGRAVGETMIMVMATGNTPVTEWNIFSGMRTLAANIAVELPEAAPASTHYRTLFLGALVLFMMTFALNSLAEVLRQRLREKNSVV